LVIVVSDTSPIRALAHLKLLSVLQELFDEVLIPPAVAEELAHPRPSSPALNLSQLPMVRVRAPIDIDQVQRFRQQLDPGESEALALALEMRAVILIDELAGRKAALHQGLIAVGVIGILLRAKAHGLIPRVRPLLDQLQDETKFYMSAELRSDAIRQAGEEP
jgi:predicted nucleic acid-binding protein